MFFIDPATNASEVAGSFHIGFPPESRQVDVPRPGHRSRAPMGLAASGVRWVTVSVCAYIYRYVYIYIEICTHINTKRYKSYL